MDATPAQEIIADLVGAIDRIIEAWDKGDLDEVDDVAVVDEVINEARATASKVPYDTASSNSRQYYIETGRYLANLEPPALLEVVADVLARHDDGTVTAHRALGEIAAALADHENGTDV